MPCFCISCTIEHRPLGTTLEFDEQRIVDKVIESQVRVLREKGRFERFDEGGYSIRSAELRDAKIIARIHVGKTGGSVRNIGLITHVYRRLINLPEGLVWIAEDAYGPFAYVAGVGTIGQRPRSFLRIRAARSRGHWKSEILSRPSRRTRHQRQFESSPHDDHAELFSVGVAGAFEDSGADEALAKAFLRTVAAQGSGLVRASVDPRDLATINMLQSLGFVSDSSADHRITVTDLWVQTS